MFSSLMKSTASMGKKMQHGSRYFSSKIFTNFTSFDGNGAFQVSPQMAQFTTADSVNGPYQKVSRQGALMLSWTQKKGDIYDWKNKYVFSLSPTEGAKLILSLNAGSSLTLTHNARAEDEQNKKMVTMEPTPGGGCTLDILTGDGSSKSTLSPEDLYVLKVLIEDSIPRMLAFPQAFDYQQSAPSTGGYGQNNTTNYSNQFKKRPSETPGAWPF